MYEEMLHGDSSIQATILNFSPAVLFKCSQQLMKCLLPEALYSSRGAVHLEQDLVSDADVSDGRRGDRRLLQSIHKLKEMHILFLLRASLLHV